MLPSYVEEMNLPGFGLLDRGPPVPLMTVRPGPLGGWSVVGGGVVRMGCLPLELRIPMVGYKWDIKPQGILQIIYK